MLPSPSVEVSVNCAVSPLMETVKSALGALLPGPLPPMAAATAASASTMPAPQPPLQLPGSGRAVCLSTASTWAGVSGVGAAACISATTPATCGAAIEVPWNEAYDSPVGLVEPALTVDHTPSEGVAVEVQAVLPALGTQVSPPGAATSIRLP